jgi:hypothetical protein
MGRKPLKPDAKKSRRFQVLVTPAEGAAVMDAVEAGAAPTASEYFRRAALEKLGKTTEKK